AIETGYVQREIQESAYRYQRAIETQEAIVVGVNRFETKEESKVATLRVNPDIERQQVERVRALRERRDAQAVEGTLANLEEAARGTDNLLPLILNCVEAYATVGEISDRLRKVWGEYRESLTV
ncbi:MAG TPA: methylmalonyl-CoA mutase family protein, partial [Pyrinomonadaceae bacterium]|nr:methylmalonyl-CoA mutase family protein [Pyrinomonadaceae bacterium]